LARGPETRILIARKSDQESLVRLWFAGKNYCGSAREASLNMSKVDRSPGIDFAPTAVVDTTPKAEKRAKNRTKK
jgi:hypothetical protein